MWTVSGPPVHVGAFVIKLDLSTLCCLCTCVGLTSVCSPDLCTLLGAQIRLSHFFLTSLIRVRRSSAHNVIPSYLPPSIISFELKKTFKWGFYYLICTLCAGCSQELLDAPAGQLTRDCASVDTMASAVPQQQTAYFHQTNVSFPEELSKPPTLLIISIVVAFPW